MEAERLVEDNESQDPKTDYLSFLDSSHGIGHELSELERKHLKKLSDRRFSELVSNIKRPNLKNLSWNPSKTFSIMAHRQIQRRLLGTYREDQNWEKWGRRVIYGTVVACTIGSLSTSTLRHSYIIAMGLSTLILCWFLVTKYSYMMIWFYLAWLAVSFILNDPRAMFSLELTEKDNLIRNVCVLMAVAINAVSLTIHLLRTIWYPSAVKDGTLGIKYFGVRAVGLLRPNEMAYLSWPRRALRVLPWFIQKLLHIDDKLNWRRAAYSGGLDSDRRPHGAGQWKEEGVHGETLIGWWNHGVPVAPFHSLESNTGYSFRSIRIGLVSNRSESEGMKQSFFKPMHRNGELMYGVASVECSVSGMFFRHLPQIDSLKTAPSDVPKALWVIANLVSPIDSIVRNKNYPQEGIAFSKEDLGRNYLREPMNGSSYTLMEGENNEDRITCELRAAIREATALNVYNICPKNKRGIEDYKAKVEAEALIFIHGFSTTTEIGLTSLAQLITLGDFPPHILPFVFSWPCGQLLSYILARDVGATSKRTKDDFIQFLSSLAEAGISKINIMTHSMGTRVVLNACNQFEKVFQPLDDNDNFVENSKRKLRLETVTLLNPDFEEYAFVSINGTYDYLRAFCPVITVFADTNDTALLVGSLINMNASLGKATKGLQRKSDERLLKHSFLQESGTSTLSSTEKERLSQVGMMSLMHKKKSYLDHIHYINAKLMENSESMCARMDLEGGPVARMTDSTGLTFGYRNLKPFIDEDEQEYILLDVDLIDTTWLENNVHNVRHSFFNLNPSIVDDLRDLIVDHKRAEFRYQTTHKFGNVYCYMVAPNVVTNA